MTDWKITSGRISPVHGMVHHLQNLANLKFECPMAREKLAYLAQDKWLGRFGTSLEKEGKGLGKTIINGLAAQQMQDEADKSVKTEVPASPDMEQIRQSPARPPTLLGGPTLLRRQPNGTSPGAAGSGERPH